MALAYAPGPFGSNAASRALVRPCRSEEHTSELQSRQYLVCRLLLEKKNTFAFLTLPSIFPLPAHPCALASPTSLLFLSSLLSRFPSAIPTLSSPHRPSDLTIPVYQS